MVLLHFLLCDFSFLCQSEHQLLSYSQTECGKGKCPYDPFQKTASTVVGKLASNALQITRYYSEHYQLFLWFQKSVQDGFFLSKTLIFRLTIKLK